LFFRLKAGSHGYMGFAREVISSAMAATETIIWMEDWEIAYMVDVIIHEIGPFAVQQWDDYRIVRKKNKSQKLTTNIVRTL